MRLSLRPVLLLSLLLIGCSGSEPAPQNSEGEGPIAVLTVSLPPLREGLVASVHKGPKRGVRRVLKAEDGPGDFSWTVTAGRAPVLFEARPDLCADCGLVEATLELEVGRFTPPLRGQGIEAVSRGSAHVQVPVRLQASRSMERPGWWSVQLVGDSGRESSSEWVRPFPATDSETLDAQLLDLGKKVAEAEAALLPGRAAIFQFRSWTTEKPQLRLDRAAVRVTPRLLESQLHLAPGAPQVTSVRAATVTVLGNEFQMLVSAGFGLALSDSDGEAEVPPGRAALETFLLADARGRPGRLSYSGPDNDSLLFGGKFERKVKAPRLPQKPTRPGTRRLPSRPPR